MWCQARLRCKCDVLKVVHRPNPADAQKTVYRGFLAMTNFQGTMLCRHTPKAPRFEPTSVPPCPCIAIVITGHRVSQ